jgi:mRNA-degrading endonuclease RelE of RelBE toxin-antitoxin system
MTKICAKDIEQLKKNEPHVFRSIQGKVKWLLAGTVPLESVQGHKNIFKTRTGKYRIVYTYQWDEILLLIVIRKRDVVYRDLQKIMKHLESE